MPLKELYRKPWDGAGPKYEQRLALSALVLRFSFCIASSMARFESFPPSSVIRMFCMFDCLYTLNLLCAPCPSPFHFIPPISFM
jgi:hypothetical protein